MSLDKKAIIICNSKCVCCNKVEEEMVKVGALVTCNDCYVKEFVITGVINQKTGEYNSDHPVYKEKLQEWKNTLLED